MARKRNATTTYTLCCAVLVGSLIAQVRPSFGRPGSVVTNGSPSPTPPVSDIRDLGAGDMTFASSTGAFQYTYTIAVPPGRLGVQPKLALNYSSQGPLRGGIASGWTMGIPEIKLEYPNGRLNEPVFVSSLSGGHRLVRTNEPTKDFTAKIEVAYRAEYDDSYTRYSVVQREAVLNSAPTGGMVTAMTLDGMTYTFGEPSHMSGTHSDSRWPLTTSVDRFGNEVEYFYSAVDGNFDGFARNNPQELVLKSIYYGTNTNAGLQRHARVVFDQIVEPACPTLASTSPVAISPTAPGASFTFEHSRGAKKLTTIRTMVKDDPSETAYRPVRVIELGYDATAQDCSAPHGGLRILDSITEYAPATLGDPAPGDHLAGSGAWISKPPVTFDYGPLSRSWNTTGNTPTTYTSGERTEPVSYATHSRWPSLDSMLLDINGDGFLDKLAAIEPSADGSYSCSMNIRLGDGTAGSLGSANSGSDHELPVIPWKNQAIGPVGDEGCSLAGQFTMHTTHDHPKPTKCPNTGAYNAYKFMDMNADGLPDLVTEVSADPGWLFSWDTGSGMDDPDLPDYDPNDIGECPVIDPGRLAITEVCDSFGFCEFDESMVATALDSSDRQLCGVLAAEVDPNPVRNGSRSLEEILHTWEGENLVIPDYTQCPIAPRRVPQTHNGRYVWHWYENTGGQFAANSNLTLAPVPLSANAGDAHFGTTSSSSATHRAFFDITGDGITDAISMDSNDYLGLPGSAGNVWWVWPGDGDGNFLHRRLDALGRREPFMWHVPVGSQLSTSASGWFLPASDLPDAWTSGTSAVRDVNADGLPDLLRYLEPPRNLAGTYVFLNSGTGFKSFTGFSGNIAPVDEQGGYLLSVEDQDGATSPDLQFLTLAHTSLSAVYDELGDATDRFIPNATRESRLVLADIDGDGLLDRHTRAGFDPQQERAPLVIWGAAEGRMRRNSSLAPANFTVANPLTERIVATPSHWSLKATFMDFNGDGVLDQGESGVYRTDDFSDGIPMRLMVTVNNGNGRTSKIRYAPHNSGEVATSNQGDGGMPHHTWVVKSVEHDQAVATGMPTMPNSIMEVKYGAPVWNEDNHGRWGFRGFESIETSSPHAIGATSGFSVTENRYDYSLDWSGRISETVTYADGFDKLAAGSIVEQTYALKELFEGAAKSFQPWLTVTRNCTEEDESVDSFVGYATCLARPRDSWSSNAYSPLRAFGAASTTPALAYVHSQTTRLIAPGYTDGARLEALSYKLFSNEDTYWLSDYAVYKDERVDASWIDTSKFLNYVDGNSKYVQKVRTSTDSGEYLYDRHLRDNLTGLVVERESRNGFGTGAKTVFGYEGFRITPVSVTNELGHISTSATDNGTGQIVRTQGPRFLSDCGSTDRAGSRTEYDGFGRPTASYEIGCKDGAFTDSRLQSTIQYVDHVAGTPAHVITTQHLDDSVSPSRTSTTILYFDGSGRTLRTKVDDDTVEGIVSTFVFDARGNLVRSIGPNPDTASTAGSTVDVSYSYDSLGRIIQVRQSPQIDGANATGADISYGFDGDRTVKRVFEHASSATVAVSETKSFFDFFGRLVQVDELLEAGGYAQTYYEYDGNDNMQKITDADLLVTEMEHDWVGRRTKIVRGAREWTYAYDKNGNVTFETGPNDTAETANDLQAGVYTTSTVYDELDRPTSRILATNGLLASELDDFDAREVGYSYDDCTNGIGQVCMVTTGANLTTNYVYDYAGRVLEQHQDIELPESLVDFGDADSAPDFSDSRATYMEYNLSGAVTDLYLADSPAKSMATHLSYTFDALGAPETMIYHAATGNVATTVVRNKAQLVTQQTTGCLTRDWQYDHKGRVIDTVVTSAACSTQNGVLLSEQMDYGDTSEVDSHDIFRVGLPARNFSYEYNAQHQLVGATNNVTGQGGYNVGFDYTTAGRLNSVGGRDALPIVGRNAMDYVGGYGDGSLTGGDFHAPVDLLGDLDVYYDYDFSGNVTRRNESNGLESQTWDFSYDGTDQQREVLLDNGTGGRELYYYDKAGSRYMAITYNSWDVANPPADPVPDRIRLWFGGAEMWFTPEPFSNASMWPSTSYAHLSLGALTVGRVKTEARNACLGLFFAQFLQCITQYAGYPKVSSEASFHNGLGHLMSAADWDTGVVSASFIYGPYGEVLESLGAGLDEHLRRFNGKEADQLSRLNYYGYRYYDPLSLTWTQADPLFRIVPDLAYDSPRLMSLYAFSLNNPVRYMDPDGRRPWMMSSRAERNMDAGAIATARQCGSTCGVIGAVGLAVLLAPLAAVIAPEATGAALAVETGADVVQAGAALQNLVANPSMENLAGAGLAIGDVLSGPGAGAEAVTARRASKSTRAEDARAVANAAPGPLKNRRTVTAVDTGEGTRVVAGGASDLSAKQKEVARQRGLVVADDSPGDHAETTAIMHIGRNGGTVDRGTTTNNICGDCRNDIENAGGTIYGPKEFGK